MKKRILIVLLSLVCALCVAVGLTACNKGTTGGKTDNTTNNEQTDNTDGDSSSSDGGSGSGAETGGTEQGSTESGSTDGGTESGGSTSGGTSDSGSTDGGTEGGTEQGGTEGGDTEQGEPEQSGESTHTHIAGAAVKENEVAATCIKTGSYDSVIYCTTCGEEISRETITVPVTAHTYNGGEVTTAATCTETGVKTYTCTVCGTTKTEEISALGHDYVREETLAPTYTTTGLYTYTCSRCNDSYTKEIAVLGHEHEYTSSVTTAATCTTDGVLTYVCSLCDDTYTETIPATGHTLTQVAEKTATCTETGWNAYEYCSVCDYTTYAAIPAKGHTYAYKYDDNGHWQVCSACGAQTAKESHSITNGECTVCDFVEQLGYTQSGDGYVVSNIGNVSSTTVTIPETYEGKTVTGIADNAFSGNVLIIIVIIPDSVTTIGDSAFSGCTSLTDVTIGGNVTTIGSNAFKGCTSLTEVTFGSSVTAIGDGAFSGCVKIENLEVGGSITTIGANAFSGCTLVNKLTIGSGVQSIGSGAFSGCTSLTEVSIPSSVTSIGANAFADCTTIVVIVILGNVNIGSGAFSGCTYLTSLTLSDSLIASLYDILESAFANSTLLTAVYDVSGNAYHPHRLTYNVQVDATCTATGTAENWYCSKCGKYYSNSNGTIEVSKDSLTIAATGHTLTQVAAQAATCTEIGWNAYEYCTVCDYTTYVEIPATGHTYVYKYDDNSHWQVCSVCSDTTDSVSHTLENSICTICGYEELKVSEDLAYTLSTDGNYYTVSGIGTCSDTDIVIPSTYNNKPVTAIAEGAFENQTQLTSVYVPNCVTSIGDYAFYYCTSLTSVAIPDSVTSIGEYAFYNCTSLTSIEVSSGNTAYKSIDGNLYSYDGTTLIQYAVGKTGTSFTIPDSVISISSYAFKCGVSLTSIIVPDGVTSIGSGAFSGCSSLVSINLPFIGGSVSATSASGSTLFGYIFGSSNYTGSNKTSQYYRSGDSTTYYIPKTLTTVTITGGNILYGAFYNCSLLTSVTIGSGVTSIGEYAFEGCSSLTSVTIGNSVTSISIYAFEYCSSLTSITIPNSVTSIGNHAFSYCYLLTSITIPDRVTSIGEYAFYNCTSLTSVSIGSGVTSIGKYAFSGCSKLTSVTFEDTTTWYYSYTSGTTTTSIGISSYLADTSTAATYLTSTYCDYRWYKN